MSDGKMIKAANVRTYTPLTLPDMSDGDDEEDSNNLQLIGQLVCPFSISETANHEGDNDDVLDLAPSNVDEVEVRYVHDKN